MEEIITLLKTDFNKGLKKLQSNSKNTDEIKKYIKEYKDKDRTIRQSQVGNIQKDKSIGRGDKSKLVKAIRSIVNFQKKIVTTSAAFEVGEEINLIPEKENELSKEVISIWKSNRFHDKIQKAKLVQKSQTECAFQFYIKKNEEDPKNEIKVKLLTNEQGKMSPYFDEYGDMIAFTWEFVVKNNEGKDIKNAWIFYQKKCYKFSEKNGKMEGSVPELHGFSKIPIVYISQDFPEWEDVGSLIDRYETSISKLGASNDYSGYPLLKLYGTVESMPDRNDDGKTLKFPMKEVDENSGKTIHGDAEFLTNNNAPESVKLEIETLEKQIFSMSSTPNLSFDNLKGSVGAISGVALKLLFLDSTLKAKMNEGENRTMVERLINVLISGITTTTTTKLSGLEKETKFTIKFNSILPDDLETAVNVLSQAKTAGIVSSKTAIEQLDIVEDVNAELELIKGENTTNANLPTAV